MTTHVACFRRGLGSGGMGVRFAPLARVSPHSFSGARNAVPSGRMQTRMGCNGKFFVGGNWKCNGSKDSVAQLVADLNSGGFPGNTEVVCAPTSLHLGFVSEHLDSKFQVAAQNCWVGSNGAFTGEVSADMLADASIPWVILGHSERRALIGESNEFVAEKCRYAIQSGLRVIACIGETLEERESGKMFDVLGGQMAAIAGCIAEADWSQVVLAYEPVWAIGTGVVATPAQAQEVHAHLRSWMATNVSEETSKALRIIYGGSVNAGNCEELAGMGDVDGFLVGGASLKGADFITIANAFEKQPTAA